MSVTTSKTILYTSLTLCRKCSQFNSIEITEVVKISAEEPK